MGCKAFHLLIQAILLDVTVIKLTKTINQSVHSMNTSPEAPHKTITIHHSKRYSSTTTTSITAIQSSPVDRLHYLHRFVLFINIGSLAGVIIQIIGAITTAWTKTTIPQDPQKYIQLRDISVLVIHVIGDLLVAYWARDKHFYMILEFNCLANTQLAKRLRNTTNDNVKHVIRHPITNTIVDAHSP